MKKSDIKKVVTIKGYMSMPIMAHNSEFNFLGTSNQHTHPSIKLPNIYTQAGDWHHLVPVEVTIKISKRGVN